MRSISRGLQLVVAVVLLSVPVLADNGTILHFKKNSGSSSTSEVTKAVPVGKVIKFSPEGLTMDEQVIASFKDFGVVEFSADRSAATPSQGDGSSTNPNASTTVNIVLERTYSAVEVIGEGEVTPVTPDPDPEDPTPPTPVVQDLKYVTITVTGSYVYTGSPIIPTFTVSCDGKTLSEGSDYVVELFYNNVVGRSFISITAASGSNYTGSKMQEFYIAPCDLSDATLTLAETKYEYTGDAIKPEVTVVVDGKTLTKDVNYEVSYSNNVEPGTASITITGKDNYAGSATTTFVIEKPALVLTLDGETITPTFNPSGAIAFYTGTHGSAYVKGYSVATGDTVEVTVTPSEGYIVKDFRLTGNLEYKEVPMSDNSVRYKYANPAGSMTIAILFDVDPYTGINSEVADGLRFTVVDASTVRVTGAEETAKVSVYDARGQQVDADVLRSANTLLVCLSRQPQGLYIIKVNNNTFKIYKK